MNKIVKTLILLSITGSFLLTAFKVKAVTLSFDPREGELQPGDTFLVKLLIDTKECINALDITIGFSENLLSVSGVNTGSSIISFWIKEPVVNNDKGTVSFTGGVPGGYCGKVAGDPGVSNVLAELVLSAPSLRIGEGKDSLAELVFLQDSEVLLHDGQGTPAELELEKGEFTILSERKEETRDEWKEKIRSDQVPPEPFKIYLRKEKEMFRGKYFLVFSTTDKQTGVSYFEVKEEKGNWEKATSPYPLKDQELEGIIKVRAVDKAGNKRVEEYMPQALEKEPILGPITIFILFLSLTIVFFIVFSTLKKKDEARKE